jgi:hypothetical protein
MTGAPDLDELRDVMRSQAASLPDNVDRDHEVHDRIAAHRRRRMVAGTAGTVVLAAAASVLAITWLPGGADTGTPKPAPIVSGTQDQPLPEYLRGGRLIASKEATDARGITMTFTPTSLDFGFVMSCANAQLAMERQPRGANFATSTVNGEGADGTSCGTTLGLSGDANFGRDGVDAGQRYGVVVGQPVVVHLAFDHGASHQGTQWRIGVYEPVPLADYPFPSRPAHLLPLTNELRYPPLAHLKLYSTRSSGLATEASFPVHHGLTVRSETVVPGALRLYVDGRLLSTSYSWTYDNEQSEASFTLAELGVHSGQWVKVRFTWQPFTTTSEIPRSGLYRVYDNPGLR